MYIHLHQIHCKYHLSTDGGDIDPSISVALNTVKMHPCYDSLRSTILRSFGRRGGSYCFKVAALNFVTETNALDDQQPLGCQVSKGSPTRRAQMKPREGMSALSVTSMYTWIVHSKPPTVILLMNKLYVTS